MEVHSHSHTGPDSHRGLRKKWKHYLWEFLMLFLAVFCGFIAEDLLDHKIEKKKAHQYIQSFYEDLKADTTDFSWMISYYEQKTADLAKRVDCYDTITRNFGSTDCLQELFINSNNFPDFVHTDRTLVQLKNAGGLRLLPAEDADSILFYDNSIKHYVLAETTSFQETQTNIRNTLYSLINYKKINQKEKQEEDVPLLYSKNEDLLNRYFNELEAYAGYCDDNLKDIKNLKLEAIVLLTFFKNKYHFK